MNLALDMLRLLLWYMKFLTKGCLCHGFKSRRCFLVDSIAKLGHSAIMIIVIFCTSVEVETPTTNVHLHLGLITRITISYLITVG